VNLPNTVVLALPSHEQDAMTYISVKVLRERIQAEITSGSSTKSASADLAEILMVANMVTTTRIKEEILAIIETIIKEGGAL